MSSRATRWLGSGLAFTILVMSMAAGAAEETEMSSPKLHSLTPPVLLPDGQEFRTWRPALTFGKTYHVDGAAKNAADDNPGTKARPFKTIQRAAELLKPGQRVVVAGGVYREWVRPRRGGSSAGTSSPSRPMTDCSAEYPPPLSSRPPPGGGGA